MSGPEMEPPTQSLADANDAEAAHDDRAGEWMREQSGTPWIDSQDAPPSPYPIAWTAPPTPRASAVPERVKKVLALNDLTLAEAQRMDADELMGIPHIGPASLAYIRETDARRRSTSTPPLCNQSAFMRALVQFWLRLGGSGR